MLGVFDEWRSDIKSTPDTEAIQEVTNKADDQMEELQDEENIIAFLKSIFFLQIYLIINRKFRS